MNITSNSEEPLKAAHAYTDIIDSVNAARNAGKNSKYAAGNATELVSLKFYLKINRFRTMQHA